MALSTDEVKRIAHLARIGIREEDIAAYSEQLSRILDFVAHMEAVDTSQVPPMAHPLDMPQRMRPDVVIEHDQRERFQDIAPQVAQGYYLVPRVVE